MKPKEHHPLLSPAEKKLLVILFVYVTCALIDVVAISISQLRTVSLLSTLTRYFACELNGHVPGKCLRERNNIDIWLISIQLLLFCLLPALNLFFLASCNTACNASCPKRKEQRQVGLVLQQLSENNHHSNEDIQLSPDVQETLK